MTAVDTPFFVVGCGRSGTTLLQRFLSAHPRLAIPPESWFLRGLVRRAVRPDPVSAREWTRLVADLVESPGFRRFGISAQELRGALGTTPDLERLMRAPFEIYAHRRGKVRWGDKTPRHVLDMRQLNAVFPGARFVHMIRDGRDVALSF